MELLSEGYLTRVSFFMNSIVTFPHRSLEFTENIISNLDDSDEMKRVCEHMVGLLSPTLDTVEQLLCVSRELQTSRDVHISSAGACLENAIRLFEELPSQCDKTGLRTSLVSVL